MWILWLLQHLWLHVTKATTMLLLLTRLRGFLKALVSSHCLIKMGEFILYWKAEKLKRVSIVDPFPTADNLKALKPTSMTSQWFLLYILWSSVANYCFKPVTLIHHSSSFGINCWVHVCNFVFLVLFFPYNITFQPSQIH